QVAAQAIAALGKTEAVDVRDEVAIATARARGSCGRRQPLGALAVELARRHIMDLRLEAALAEAEIALACGDGKARATLAALAREAEHAGFARVARLAAAGAR